MSSFTAFVATVALGSVRGAQLADSSERATDRLTAHLKATLGRVELSRVKPYGEALGGAALAVIGLGFWLWPAP